MRLPRNTSLAPPKRSLMKNRPMEGTNVKTQPASTPGAVRGSVTVTKARRGEAPMSRLASTSAQSIFSTEE